MNDLYIRDNPDRVGDPVEYTDPDEHRKYATCAWCGKLIRPYNDPYCYDFYIDEPLHKDCYRQMCREIRERLKDKRKLEDLFDLMIDAYESYGETHTPDHSYDV